jgi:hypothetical protein
MLIRDVFRVMALPANPLYRALEKAGMELA